MVLSFVYLLLAVVHPFHVSVMEIKFKEDQKVLQISTRIFLDDLEVALQKYSGNDNLDITEAGKWEEMEELIGGYLLERVSLKDEKKAFELNYLGAEIEKDVVWSYIEIEKVKRLKTITLKNEILLETYDDQENLVHFRAFDKVKSARIYTGEEQKLFNWE